MITSLSALPPNPYTIKIKKGAVITATFDQQVGGIIKIMVFPSTEITRKEYINTPPYQGTIHMVFTHKEAIIKDKSPSDSHSLSQYIPFGLDRLNEHKIAPGRFLITKDITPNNETRIYDEDVRYMTSIIEGDGDVLRHDLKTALIGKYLPAIGIKFTDAKWATTKIIMETIEPAITALNKVDDGAEVQDGFGDLFVQEEASLGALFGYKPVIEVYYDPTGIMGGKPGCIRARVKDDHKIHAAGVNETDTLRDLMLTLKNYGMTHDPDDYTIEHITPESKSSVARLIEEHELRKDECALGKKLKEYIHNKFEGSDKIEIDIPNIKVTKGSFEHSYRLDVITETILYKHHR